MSGPGATPADVCVALPHAKHHRLSAFLACLLSTPPLTVNCMASFILWLLAGTLLAASWAWAFYGNQAQAAQCFGVAAMCAGVALMAE